MDKKTCSTCKYFGFCDPAPPYGHRSNLFCKLHKKRITDKGCGGVDWVDAHKKSYAPNNQKNHGGQHESK